MTKSSLEIHRRDVDTGRRKGLCICVLVAAVWLAGCSPDSAFPVLNQAPVPSSNPKTAAPPQAVQPSQPGPPMTAEPEPAPQPTPAFTVCSALVFADSINWPKALTLTDREALKLAFNLSGSFEGSTGWANLTNDFDGEGLSMGLLNQTLGTGSLQPLLIEMRDQYRTTLDRLLAPAHEKSLLGMLTAWQGTSVLNRLKLSARGDEALSPLDIESDVRVVDRAESSSDNAASVAWAVKNLYSGSDFIASWSKDLTALSTSPQYVSIQISAGVDLHDKALDLEKTVACDDLRCYLLMFDFVVQNGGLYQQDIEDFASYKTSHPKADETALLKELVELRLRHVRPEYVSDVRSRKNAIIDGVGVVHGQARKFESEYCFNRMDTYPEP